MAELFLPTSAPRSCIGFSNGTLERVLLLLLLLVVVVVVVVVVVLPVPQKIPIPISHNAIPTPEYETMFGT